MKRIGLVGGMTPESTRIYYETLIRVARQDTDDPLRNPVILIYSINLTDIVAHQRAGRDDAIADLLGGVCEGLRAAGAEIGALTANTPHAYLDGIVQRTKLPLVSIVDTTFERARNLGLRRVLLLGTETTMGAPMYHERFAGSGVELVVPAAAERELIDRAIYGDLAVGVVTADLKRSFLEICERAIEEDGVDAVILGCTEIPLVLGEGDLPVPLLDTLEIHAQAILARAKA